MAGESGDKGFPSKTSVVAGVGSVATGDVGEGGSCGVDVTVFVGFGRTDCVDVEGGKVEVDVSTTVEVVCVEDDWEVVEVEVEVGWDEVVEVEDEDVWLTTDDDWLSKGWVSLCGVVEGEAETEELEESCRL